MVWIPKLVCIRSELRANEYCPSFFFCALQFIETRKPFVSIFCSFLSFIWQYFSMNYNAVYGNVALLQGWRGRIGNYARVVSKCWTQSDNVDFMAWLQRINVNASTFCFFRKSKAGISPSTQYFFITRCIFDTEKAKCCTMCSLFQ